MQPEKNKSNHKQEKSKKEQCQNAARKTKAIIKATTKTQLQANMEQHGMFVTNKKYPCNKQRDNHFTKGVTW